MAAQTDRHTEAVKIAKLKKGRKTVNNGIVSKKVCFRAVCAHI